MDINLLLSIRIKETVNDAIHFCVYSSAEDEDTVVSRYWVLDVSSDWEPHQIWIWK
jgi:hypothetical protein